MEFGLKWVHMARYELILRLDGALWLTIIFKPLQTQKIVYQHPKVKHKIAARALATYLILSLIHI